MNRSYPIYTIDNVCQDCYKCVRHCPVKAIRVEGGRAKVSPELCVACGTCVKTCPAKAKKVRGDVRRVKALFESGRSVYASLAPSWVSEFPGVAEAKMVAAARRLGFAGVSETALGAQLVSQALAERLKDADRGVFFSSACPAAVSYIRKYHPAYAENIVETLSPVLAHAKLLRERLGADIAVVMLSPCAAKKTEADARPDLLDVNLTFQEFKEWLAEEKIDFNALPATANDAFYPERSEEGGLYPVEGGMIETLKTYPELKAMSWVVLTGVENIGRAIDNLNLSELDAPVFAETLACAGGCVNGPCADQKDFNMVSRARVIANARVPADAPRRRHSPDIRENFPRENIARVKATEEQIAKALRLVGKVGRDDELNCGGCGYDTCRNLALALIAGMAEPAMCVSYMRQQAQKKANALLRCIPSGAVIVDDELKIIECNARFAELFDEGAVLAYEAKPGLNGASLRKIVPFYELFEAALRSGEDIRRESFKVGRRLLDITIFSIEPRQVVGAVLFDVTLSEARREQIARRAREVIQKNLTTVQEIACMLGEHMADTEILLRDIADDYQDEVDGEA